MERTDAKRLLGIDGLLGFPEWPEGDVLEVPGASGLVRVVDLDPATSSAQFGRLRQYVLSPVWDGEPAALAALLRRWREWTVAEGAADAGPDSQLGLTWPSRDVIASEVFLAHGLVPTGTVAVRPGGRPAAPRRETPELRRATTADAAAVRELAIEEIAFDARLTPLGLRPGYEELRIAEMAEMLGGDESWGWVAERDGRLVGAVVSTRPADSTWVTPLTSLDPAAYLLLASVTESERGSGLGGALVAAAHADYARAGTAGSLLHHSTFNPLSAPFWSRMGYRPLWSIWTAEPAAGR